MVNSKKAIIVENWRLPQILMVAFIFICTVANIANGTTTYTMSVTSAIIGYSILTILLTLGGFYSEIKLPQIVALATIVLGILEAGFYDGQVYQSNVLSSISSTIVSLFIMIEGGFFA